MTSATPARGLLPSGGARGVTLATLVSAQMARTPSATALIDGATELTYADLDRLTDRVAAGLLRAGVVAGDLVAVLLSRSAELVATVLGIHRAGAAYVPLDPQYPRDRLQFMLDDARPAVLVCDAATAALARELGAATLVLVDELPDGAPPAPVPVRPEDLAYVLYTSGSTGRPKGAMLEHRNTVALLDWVAGEFTAADLAGVLFGTSICFDLSVFEIFGTLVLGGAIIVAPNALALPDLAARDRVTVLNTVPSVTAALLAGGDLPASVHTVIHSGDTTTRALADAVYAVPTVRRFYNLYGPTEAATWQIGHLVTRAERAEPPIGLPFPHAGAHVVDQQDRPVPDGEVGELLLSGAQVGRGYLNRPELTAEKFVERPDLADGRLYRTGDLVHRDPDGMLHYHGRVDFQVKIRGFRVELGEIESVLERDTAISDAVAVAQPSDDAEPPRLVAFAQVAGEIDASPDADGILHGHGADLLVARLRSALHAALPDYMRPDRVVVTRALPLTANGKPDRARLPRLPSSGDGARPVDGRAPRTAAERLVADVWRETLECGDEVSIPADVAFSALGGDSLRAAGVTSRLRHRHGARITLREFLAAPTVAALAARMEADGTGLAGAAPVAIPHDEAVAPPTPAQREHWLGDQLVAGSSEEPVGLWTVPLLLRVDGPLDPGVLQHALDALVSRHRVLRRAMPELDVAELVAPYPVPLEIVDLRGRPADAHHAAAAAQHAEAAAALDLRAGRVVRAQLVRLADDHHELLVHVHHACFDGLSTRALVADLAAGYAARCAGRPLPPAPRTSFDDAARWLAREEPHVEYWAKRLAGAAPEQGAPGGGPRMASIWAGGRVVRPLDPDFAARVRRFAADRGSSLFALVLAATAIRVYRETGRTDVLLPAPVSSRRHPDLEGVIGLLHEMVPMRCDLSGAPTFGELVTRLGGTVAADLEHPAPPWAKLRQLLGQESGASVRPADLVVAMQRGEPPVRQAPLTWTYLAELDNGGAKSDFTLFWESEMPRPQVCAEFAAQRYTADDARALLDQILAVLAAGIADPDVRIDELDWVSAAQHASLTSWCGSGSAHGDERSVLTRVLRRAGDDPDAVAVEDARLGAVTYAQLLAGARRLAARLPDGVALVAIGARRGVKGIAAALASWLRGAAYLPLDVAHPQRRIEDVLSDAQPDAIVADHHLPAVPGQRLDLDALLGDDPARWTAHDPAWPAPRGHDPAVAGPDAGDPAYLLYTSGSTGRPKGVRVSHGALGSFLTAIGEIVPIGTSDVVSYLTAPSFDISGLEIWLPLSCGARLRVVDEDTVKDGFALAERLRGVSVAQMTPTGFGVLLAAGWDGDPALRVLVGGEALPPTLAAALLPRCAEVWNVYGPTEATIWSTVHRVTEADTAASAIPLGKPLPNTVVHVLDAGGAPVPPGVAGEICLGGYSLALGYHDQPALTAERFVSLPHVPHGGAGTRFYRTGDRGRWRADGNLEYLGRADGQVKIRGVRVEVGDVEAALSRLPGVRAAAVGVSTGGDGGARLVAYLVADGGLSDDEARAQLAQVLPAAMVPELWVRLPRLPLTANGKLDRAALPAPAAAQAARVPPATAMEEVVAYVWSEVLAVADVGRDDDFLARGGHSLLATKVAAQLRADLDLAVPVSAVFTYPRLRDFAAHLEALLDSEAAG